MNRTVRVRKLWAWVACAAMVAVWSGCGGVSNQQLAPVKGKVVYDGQGVKGGTVTFRPVGGGKPGMPGKAASGEVQQDGTFVLGTFKTGDGATVGKCEVTFMPSLPSPKDYDDKPEMPAWIGTAPKTKQVEVQSGQNDFTIELVKKGQAAGAQTPPPGQ